MLVENLLSNLVFRTLVWIIDKIIHNSYTYAHNSKCTHKGMKVHAYYLNSNS